MVEIWFALAAMMLAAYVVLDGFDFGAGALHLAVARTNTERREVLASIGPFWDGNEVWLLASGGVLFVAFPKVLASGLSGFYFALFLVLWCLVLRGIAIEFRSHVDAPLWRAFWDVVFSLASGALAVLFGVALGNLVRGVPLDERGWFALPLFTDFTSRSPVGILDAYTVLVGAFAAVALAAHGAAFLAWKTTGPVHGRSLAIARRLFVAVGLLWPAVTIATRVVNREFFGSVPSRPIIWLAVLFAAGGLTAAIVFTRRVNELRAFAGSCAFLGGLLAATAAALFPVLLRSSDDPARSITAHAAANTPHSLFVALVWLSIGLPLAVLYLAAVFRMNRGKVVASDDGEGY